MEVIGGVGVGEFVLRKGFFEGRFWDIWGYVRLFLGLGV